MTKLKYNTVSEVLLNTLHKCMKTECLKDFILVGGTSLALQRGHRTSVDIDLFTDMEYGTMPLSEIKQFMAENFTAVDGLDSLNNSALGYHLYVNDENNSMVKIDLFYTEKFIFPIKEINGIRIADEREIAAMKMLAIAGPIKRVKDFWDINELNRSYSLCEMIKWGLERNPYSLDIEDIKDAFENIKNVKDSLLDVVSLTGENWEIIQEDLLCQYQMELDDINRIIP